MPKVYKQLRRIRQTLESHYRDMQDIEFTIQANKLWMLQTRTGKRTVRAAVKIAVEMAHERLISREVAVGRVDARLLDQLLHPTLDPDAPKNVIAKGLPHRRVPRAAPWCSPPTRPKRRPRRTRRSYWCASKPLRGHPRHVRAEGILTARGGMTSHAAVVARGMGKCCVVGCGTLADLLRARRAARRRQAGAGRRRDHHRRLDRRSDPREVATVTPELSGEFGELMKWADGMRRLEVHTNADTPHDAKVARDFGAQGIGLCRTEHMFFEEARILAVREMILATDEVQRGRALDKLLPMQRGDFVGIFQAMESLPVTIRLLDPPLHEFLPHEEAGIVEVAEALGDDVAAVRARIEERSEFNPMLGHRGCRLGITFPISTGCRCARSPRRPARWRSRA